MPLDLLTRTPLPQESPEKMHPALADLQRSKDQMDCLHKTYNLLTKKYRGYRVKTYTRIFDIFEKNLGILWNKTGFLHCTNINYIMRFLLIQSGFFKEKDIRTKWTLLWYISPHQYLQIRINTTWVNIDVWAYTYGIRFGDYAHGFHSRS